MAVYVDKTIWHWQGPKWCHLPADDIEEPHRFAATLELRRPSYQGLQKAPSPHYALAAFERRRAIAHGAIPCYRTRIVMVLRQLRRQVAEEAAVQS